MKIIPNRRRLGVALAALLFFAWLAGAVLEGTLEPLDLAFRGAVHDHAFPALTFAMRALTWAGSAAVLAPLTLLLAVRWVGQGRRRAALLFVVAVLGAELLEQALKLAFHRPRPEPFFNLAAPFGYSFPSGHALVSCCFYGLLAANARRRQPLAWLAAALLVALIGFSRVYLGVHYPSDVIAGYAAAVVWLLAVRASTAPRRIRRALSAVAPALPVPSTSEVPPILPPVSDPSHSLPKL